MNDFELTDKQLLALQDMLQHYKEFQEELYEYPDPQTLFTQTQFELFSLFDNDSPNLQRNSVSLKGRTSSSIV
jgi:hypothetical protein